MESSTGKLVQEVSIGGSDFRGSYPNIPIPDVVKETSYDALLRKQTHYVQVPGIQPLRESVSDFLKSMDLGIMTEQVIITAGKQESYFISLQGLSRQFSDLDARGYRDARNLATYNAIKNKPIIGIPVVCHPGVRLALNVRPRQVMEIPINPELGYSPDLMTIENILSQGCDLIYLESPNQLTGFIYSEDQVENISRLLEKYDALAVWDQGLAPSVINKYVSLAKKSPDRTIVIGELWPGIGISNWQIGYVAAPAPYVEGLTAIKQVISICTGAPSQWGYLGGAKAFSEEHPHLLQEISDLKNEILATYSQDKRILAGQAESILAIDFGSQVEKAKIVINKLNIQVMDGANFNAPGILRITMKPDALTVKTIHDLMEEVKE